MKQVNYLEMGHKRGPKFIDCEVCKYKCEFHELLEKKQKQHKQELKNQRVNLQKIFDDALKLRLAVQREKCQKLIASEHIRTIRMIREWLINKAKSNDCSVLIEDDSFFIRAFDEAFPK